MGHDVFWGCGAAKMSVEDENLIVVNFMHYE